MSRFRIVDRIAEPREIQIVAIGPRDRIYEGTYRLIRRESRGKKRYVLKRCRESKGLHQVKA